MLNAFPFARHIRNLKLQLRFLPRTFSLVWSAAGPYTTIWLILLLVQGALPIATIALSRTTMDRLLGALQSHNFLPTLVAAALLAASLLLSELLSSASAHVRTAQAELVQDHILALIHAKSLQADLAFYDSPDFHDHLHRARSDASWRPVLLLENLGALLQNSLTLAGLALLLASYAWWLPLLFLAGAVPALAVLLRAHLLFHDWRRQSTQAERRSWYLTDLITSAASAAELRLFSLGATFQDEYTRLRANLRAERLRLSARQVRARLAATILAFLAAGIAALWTLTQTLARRLSPGDLVLFYQSLQQGLRLLQTFLENASSTYSNILFLGNLYEFLDLHPQVLPPANPKPLHATLSEGIRFQDVSFTYPGSSNPTLNGFSLFLPAGQITALVGPNGAGKSTLVKLLCRFYDPQSGEILFDQIPLRDFHPDHLRRTLTALLQNPARFHDSFARNIAFGDTSRPSDPLEIRRAAEAAAAHSIAFALPRGYDTPLGRGYDDGVELSSGQWQRLALARAFYRQAPVLILDEPTSAMDPWAEADWLSRFRTLAAGRTALLITHRFSAARFADLIHVLDHGAVVQSGPHADLIRQPGPYSQAWNAQEDDWNAQENNPRTP